MFTERPPKISCLLVTEGRLDLTLRSVQCYQRQTYPNKELILLSQGNEEVNNIIFQRVKEHRDIQFFPVSLRHSLGALRNLSCEIASGSILCQWDDDDLYGPTRLIDQFKSLKSNAGNSASAFTRFFKYFANTQELYWCDWAGEQADSSRFLCGSVMFYKRTFHRYGSLLYPEIGDQCHVEEDLNALQKLLEVGNVEAVGGGHQYFYCFHGQNTYDLRHHQLTLLTQSGKYIACSDELLAHRGVIESLLTMHGIQDEVHVRSLDEVAFTYQSK